MLSKYGNCTRLLKIENKLKIVFFFFLIKSGRILDILWREERCVTTLYKKKVEVSVTGCEVSAAISRFPSRLSSNSKGK